MSGPVSPTNASVDVVNLSVVEDAVDPEPSAVDALTIVVMAPSISVDDGAFVAVAVLRKVTPEEKADPVSQGDVA